MNPKAILWTVLVVVVAVLALILFTPSSNAPAPVGQEDINASGAKDNAPDDNVAPGAVTGTWQSKDDSKAVLVLTADGVYEDRYDGEVVDSGTWLISSGLDVEAGIDPKDLDFASSLYLKKVGVNSESFYYNIAVANESELVITYLLGDVLRFQRVD